MSGVPAGQKRGAGRRTDAAAGVKLGEAQAFRGELVEIRRPDFGLPIATQVPVSEIVGHDENDARPFVGPHFGQQRILWRCRCKAGERAHQDRGENESAQIARLGDGTIENHEQALLLSKLTPSARSTDKSAFWKQRSLSFKTPAGNTLFPRGAETGRAAQLLPLAKRCGAWRSSRGRVGDPGFSAWSCSETGPIFLPVQRSGSALV